MTRTITFDNTMMDRDQRQAFKSALDEMGVTFASPSSFEQAFSRSKEAAERDGRVTGARLQAIVDEVESDMATFQGVADSYR